MKVSALTDHVVVNVGIFDFSSSKDWRAGIRRDESWCST